LSGALTLIVAEHAELSFSEDGCMDAGRFTHQQWILAASAIDSTLIDTQHDGKVLDTSTQLNARGGSWRPLPFLARTIAEAALGQVDCCQL
jgi:hypothetical protein